MLRSSILLASLLVLPGCRLGLDYSGDERGLERASVPVEGHPDRRLSYLIDGDPAAQRLIFIHGSPGNSLAYAKYLHDPVPGLETLAVDRLGYGQSTADEAVVSFEEQAAAIAPLLVERAGEWPILVGHSLGGPIAARLAADHPERVAGLIIVAGSLNPEAKHPGCALIINDGTFGKAGSARIRSQSASMYAPPLDAQSIAAGLCR